MKKYILVAIAMTVLISGCNKASSSDDEEAAQQVGDVMASIDESGGSSGTIAFVPDVKRTFDRLNPAPWYTGLLEKEAQAAVCGTSTFGTCTNNTITRTFGGCTIGATSFSGTVSLTWSDAVVDSTCQMTTTGHSITRVPNFTVTGRRGATLTVTKTGTVGQKIERTGTGVFAFTNDGINRKFTAGTTTLFDQTTKTTSAITVTGSSRSSRVLSGGVLEVINNLSGVTCDLVPSNVTWSSGCNCAQSGTWEGSCSDSKTFKLEMTGCGTANFTFGSNTTTVSFDRCQSV